MFKNLDWKRLIYLVLSFVLGGTAVTVGPEILGSSEEGQVVISTENAPVFVDPDLAEGQAANLLEVWCNCYETSDKITHIGGQESQPQVPYEDAVSAFTIVKFRTNLRPGAITVEVANKLEFCGKNKATAVVRAWKIGGK